MEQFEVWKEYHTQWLLWPVLIWLVCTTLSGILVISNITQKWIEDIQWEPIETAGPDMPIYTKTKEWLLHLFGKWAESDKPKVIASSEDKK